jgi:hypothetical protein
VLSLSGSIAFTVEEYGLIHAGRSGAVPFDDSSGLKAFLIYG